MLLVIYSSAGTLDTTLFNDVPLTLHLNSVFSLVQVKRTLKPADRVKQMTVLLDTAVSENAAIMSELTAQLQEMSVIYRVGDLQPPGSVRWKRKTLPGEVGDETEVTLVSLLPRDVCASLFPSGSQY